VLGHLDPRRVRVVRADRAIHAPVHLGGLAQVARPLDRLPAQLVELRRDHLHERRQHAVAAAGRDRPVEAHVVHQEGLGVLERGEHLGHLLGHRREVLRRGVRGGEAGDAHLQHQARLEHLVRSEAVQRGEQAERLDPEVGRALGDERARPAARHDDAHRLERLQPRAHARPADAQLGGEVALARQPVARPHRAPLDQLPDVLDDAVARAGGVERRLAPRAHAISNPGWRAAA
jgi:hypothetical protein